MNTGPAADLAGVCLSLGPDPCGGSGGRAAAPASGCSWNAAATAARAAAPAFAGENRAIVGPRRVNAVLLQASKRVRSP